MNAIRKAPTFELIEISGPVGKLECLRLNSALVETRGIVLVAHPNPTEGGTFTNKIVHTVAKTLSRLGYVAYCPNLRGVGNSEGAHERGVGEVDDMAAVLAHARREHPICTGWYSRASRSAPMCKRNCASVFLSTKSKA
jgi:uncharacterized protein